MKRPHYEERRRKLEKRMLSMVQEASLNKSVVTNNGLGRTRGGLP